METEELRAVLSAAGLSPYQIAAYLTVLERGSAAATEIAAASDVPDPRIYDVLRALDREGYVETYEQGTLHVRARDPAEALSLHERAERFEAAASEIERRFERPAPAIDGYGASIVSRFETVLDGARQAIAEASDQVQLVATAAQIESLRESLERTRERGVDVRVSIPTDPRSGEGADSLPARDVLRDICTEARHRPLPAPFLAIVDRETACFAPHPSTADRYGVLIEDRIHAYVFHWYFLSSLWEACETIYDARPTEPPIEYVDVRQCIREVGPLLGENAVHARITGQYTATGDPVTLAGRITDVRYAGDRTEGESAELVHLAIRATIRLETEEKTHEIGGWGAILEPIEATRVTIERIEKT